MKAGEGFTGVYDWSNECKSIGSFFIGTSPELDLAVYTICFMTREGGKCYMQYNGVPFSITSYTLDQNGKTHIGSAFPDWP